MNIRLQFPGISQSDFEDAFQVMEECKHPHARKYGFRYPYFSPGGAYGECWWASDFSMTMSGYKWFDPAFCERGVLNLIETQREDGRIALWGVDHLSDDPKHSRQKTDVASIPLFEYLYPIARRSGSRDFQKQVYDLFVRNLEWWYANRLDRKTGLITAVFEETIRHYLYYAGEFAALDTNVDIVLGLHVTAALARELGYDRAADMYLARKKVLMERINQYLWDEERGVYDSLNLKTGKMEGWLSCTAFFPLTLEIAPEDRRQRLIALLTDNAHFNWDVRPVTTVSLQDKSFVAHNGEYLGNVSWEGSVWTHSNQLIVRGLLHSGYTDLAADLALKTVRMFNRNYAEFLNPFDGSGQGVARYAWTAAQYTFLLFEVIFGLDFHGASRTLTIAPHLTPELRQETLAVYNLPIPTGGAIDIEICHGQASWTLHDADIQVRLG